MPQGNAILDYSPIAAAGHVIPQSYVQNISNVINILYFIIFNKKIILI